LLEYIAFGDTAVVALAFLGPLPCQELLPSALEEMVSVFRTLGIIAVFNVLKGGTVITESGLARAIPQLRVCCLTTRTWFVY